MKSIPVFYGSIKNGRVQLDKAGDFEQYLKSLEDKEVVLSIKKLEYERTSAENRYYWGVVVKMVADEMAVIPDEAHDFLKSLFLKVGVEVKGKRYEIIRSTASLTIGEFEEYVEKCRQWSASELNCPIPEPNEIIEN